MGDDRIRKHRYDDGYTAGQSDCPDIGIRDELPVIFRKAAG